MIGFGREKLDWVVSDRILNDWIFQVDDETWTAGLSEAKIIEHLAQPVKDVAKHWKLLSIRSCWVVGVVEDWNLLSIGNC